MEHVLNFPYEENINLNSLEQIVQKKCPSCKVKKGKKSIEMSKNFFVSVRFTIKADGNIRQLFYKTKMNIWILVFILISYVFCGCYCWSEWGHFNDDDIMVIAISSIVPFMVWLVYLIIKIGLITKVRRALEQEIPNYIVNRVEYFFPSKAVVERWKQDMLPVSWIIVLWGIIRVSMGILVGIPVITHYISDYISEIQNYGNLISNLFLLLVAVIFVMKNYNHYWQIAKYLFLSYTIWIALLSLLPVLGMSMYFDSTALFLTVNAIENSVSWVLMAVFAYFFYRSLSNTPSLYLLKAAAIWILFSVFLLVDFSYFDLTYQTIPDYDSYQSVFGYESPEYTAYKKVLQSYQLRSYIWSVVAGWTYIIGLVKPFLTLKNYIPQGIGIKID